MTMLEQQGSSHSKLSPLELARQIELVRNERREHVNRIDYLDIEIARLEQLKSSLHHEGN